MRILYSDLEFGNCLIIGFWLLVIIILVSYIHNVSYLKKVVKGVVNLSSKY